MGNFNFQSAAREAGLSDDQIKAAVTQLPRIAAHANRQKKWGEARIPLSTVVMGEMVDAGELPGIPMAGIDPFATAEPHLGAALRKLEKVID